MAASPRTTHAAGPLSSAIRQELERRNIGIMDFCHAVAGVGDDPPHWRSVHRITTGETGNPHAAMREAIEQVLGWPTGATSRIIAGEDVEVVTKGPSWRESIEADVAQLKREVSVLLADYSRRRDNPVAQ